MTTEKFIANKQLLQKIKEILDFQKQILDGFYKKNIGEIDKIKAISLEEYMVSQFNKPTSSSTIKLHKNKYILQKKEENSEGFTYIPFEKKITPIIPNDDDVLKSLEKKYKRYKPITKKQLIERVCEKHKETIKENKITKKTINSLNYMELNKIFKNLGITELDEALRYYRLKEKISISQKRGLEDFSEQSDFFNEFHTLFEKAKEQETYKILQTFFPLYKTIEREIDTFVIKLYNNDNDIDKKLLTISKTELLEKIFTPEDSNNLNNFFKQELDFYNIKQDVFSKKLNLDFKISFRFFQPCDNLSGVNDRFNSIEYASAQNNTSSMNFEENAIIKLS